MKILSNIPVWVVYRDDSDLISSDVRPVLFFFFLRLRLNNRFILLQVDYSKKKKSVMKNDTLNILYVKAKTDTRLSLKFRNCAVPIADEVITQIAEVSMNIV